jgi:hypothetical protein
MASMLTTRSLRTTNPFILKEEIRLSCKFNITAAKLCRLKPVPLHAMEALGRKIKYSSYSFSTSVLDGVSGQRHAPAAL